MNRNLRGILCTLAGGIFWGFSGACGQYLFMRYNLDTSWLTAVRMISAGVILTLFSLIRSRGRDAGIWKTAKDAAQLVTFAILGLMFCQYTYLTAISHSNAGTATVLQYIGPVLIMAMVCAAKRRRPELREGIAIVLAVAGTYLLATHGNPGTMVLSGPALFWGLLSAFALALYTLLPAKLIARWGSIVVTGWGMLVGGIVLGCVIRVWDAPVILDVRGWLALSGMVVMGTVFAYTLYMQGVSDVGPVRASMLASVEPVAAMLFSVFWHGAEFMWIDLIGFVCILATVFLLAKKEEAQKEQ